MKRLGLALLAVGAWAGIACKKHEERAETRPPPGEAWLSPQQVQDGQISVVTVDERPVAAELDTPGRIAFDDSHIAHVFSPVGGRVVRIEAQLGQPVRRGAPLVTLESPDVGVAAADVGKAEADLQAAERELRRQRELFEAHAAAQRDLEAAQAARDRATAELARARQRARLFHGAAGSVSQAVALRSPIDGEVIARAVTPGMEIAGQASGGTSPELFTIGNVERVWAVADVFEMDLPRVKPGAPVAVKVVAFPERVFQGRVDWIAPALDPQTRSARVRAALLNPGRELLPEMFASFRIISGDGRLMPAVPVDAIVYEGANARVWIARPDSKTVVSRPIEVGDTTNGLVEVRKGLTIGESVVTSGTLFIDRAARRD